MEAVDALQDAADPFVRALKDAHAAVCDAQDGVKRALATGAELKHSHNIEDAITSPTLARLAHVDRDLEHVAEALGRAHLAARLAGRHLGLDVRSFGDTGAVPNVVPLGRQQAAVGAAA